MGVSLKALYAGLRVDSWIIVMFEDVFWTSLEDPLSSMWKDEFSFLVFISLLFAIFPIIASFLSSFFHSAKGQLTYQVDVDSYPISLSTVALHSLCPVPFYHNIFPFLISTNFVITIWSCFPLFSFASLKLTSRGNCVWLLIDPFATIFFKHFYPS